MYKVTQQYCLEIYILEGEDIKYTKKGCAILLLHANQAQSRLAPLHVIDFSPQQRHAGRNSIKTFLLGHQLLVQKDARSSQ
jgi:hypothetical protein